MRKQKSKHNTQIRNNKLAFGVEPSNRTYRLRLARYKALAEAVAVFVTGKGEEKFRLLDVGSGRGRSLRYIEAEEVAHLIDFYGFDLKPKRLESVYASNRWRLVQGDIQEPAPFKSGCFDIVLCEQVLEHLDNPVAAMSEIARVLKPGGLLVMGVPIFPWGLAHLRRLITGVSRDWFGIKRPHVQTFDSRSIKRLICAHDRFTISNCYGVRMISGGLISSLEDFLWWYRFNRWLGRSAPSLSTEIQVVARRNTMT
jgi:SAM-dependent methyltransferase